MLQSSRRKIENDSLRLLKGLRKILMLEILRRWEARKILGAEELAFFVFFMNFFPKEKLFSYFVLSVGYQRLTRLKVV